MSLSNESVRAIYTANGVTVSFAIPQDIIESDSSEVEVYSVNESTTPPTETLQVEGALQDYTLTGASPPATPFDTHVTFNSAPASGRKIVVQRKITLTQPTDLVVNGEFPAEEVETTLDRLVAEIQLVNHKLKRALKTRISIPDADLDLGVRDPSALQYLRWNSAETHVESAFIDSQEVVFDNTVQPGVFAATEVESALYELASDITSLTSTVSASSKVKVSSADTDAGYLSSKLASGNNRITTSIYNPGFNEVLRFTLVESNIVHQNLSGAGTNTHALIDAHIADGTIHNSFNDHLLLLNIGTNSHAAIDTHIADTTIHFTVASIDHGSIAGLTDDDHAQYFLLAGRSTGQLAYGGVAAAGGLNLISTSHTTKGLIYFGEAQVSAYDETQNYWGIGTNAPLYTLHVEGDGYISGNLAVGVGPAVEYNVYSVSTAAGKTGAGIYSEHTVATATFSGHSALKAIITDTHGGKTQSLITGLNVRAVAQLSGGTTSNVVGADISAEADQTGGAVGTLYGLRLNFSSGAFGTVSAVTALDISSSFVVMPDSFIGINVGAPTFGGTMAEAYGIILPDLSLATSDPTLGWSIYSQGGPMYHAGRIGVGSSNDTPDHQVDIVHTPSANSQYGISVETTIDGTPYAGVGAAKFVTAITASSGITAGPSAINASLISTVTGGTLGGMTGLLFTVEDAGTVACSTDVINATYTKSAVATASEVNLHILSSIVSAGTVTTLNHIKITDVQNTATVTTQYGLYMENLNGATNNFSIYSLGGTMYHAGSVGIGITAPARPLSVQSANGIQTGSSIAASTDGLVLLEDGSLHQIRGYENLPMAFYTNNTEYMRIGATGKVGVGSTMASTNNYGLLNVAGVLTCENEFIVDSAAGDTTRYFDFLLREAGAAGNFGTGLTGQVEMYTYSAADTIQGIVIGTYQARPLCFGTSNTERVRLTAAGVFCVGLTTPTIATRFETADTLTVTSGTNVSNYIGMTVTPSGASTATHDALRIEAIKTGANTLNTLRGLLNYSYNGGAGSITDQYGAWNVIQRASSGGIINGGYAAYNQVIMNAASGTAANVYGDYTIIQHTGAGTTTNAYGFYTTITKSAGTLTNAYGVYIDAIAGDTLSYGLYQAGTSPNYLAGKLGIGVVPTTNVCLDTKDGHIRSQQTTGPTDVEQAGLGATGTSVLANHTDNAGKITLTPNGAGIAAGAQSIVTFNKAFNVAPIVVLTPIDANSGANAVQVYVTSTTTTFTINFTVAGGAGTAYGYYYMVHETQ